MAISGDHFSPSTYLIVPLSSCVSDICNCNDVSLVLDASPLDLDLDEDEVSLKNNHVCRWMEKTVLCVPYTTVI